LTCVLTPNFEVGKQVVARLPMKIFGGCSYIWMAAKLGVKNLVLAKLYVQDAEKMMQKKA